MNMIKIHNVETDEVIEREMNAEELAQWEADKTISVQRKAEAQAKAQAKAEVLERLGITADEAKLLLA